MLAACFVLQLTLFQGSGNLGPFIIQELVSAGFTVTGITRESSTNSTPKFADGLDVKKVDYSSHASLRDAFAGQDAVVSVVGNTGFGDVQRVAIDAALEAGVQRFIPSEFGIHTRNAAGTTIGKLLSTKVATTDYLQQNADENPSFSWTGLSTGLFFDYVCCPVWPVS